MKIFNNICLCVSSISVLYYMYTIDCSLIQYVIISYFILLCIVSTIFVNKLL